MIGWVSHFKLVRRPETLTLFVLICIAIVLLCCGNFTHTVCLTITYTKSYAHVQLYHHCMQLTFYGFYCYNLRHSQVGTEYRRPDPINLINFSKLPCENIACCMLGAHCQTCLPTMSNQTKYGRSLLNVVLHIRRCILRWPWRSRLMLKALIPNVT